MGRTWDFNVAGVSLFADLHAAFGAKSLSWVDALPDPEEFKREQPESYEFFAKKMELPGRFKPEEAQASAAALEAATDSALTAFVRQDTQKGKWGESPQDFVGHVRAWAKFLKTARRGVDSF